MSKYLKSGALIAAACAMTVASFPAQAQFRGLFRDAQRGAQAAEGCEEGSSGDVGRGIIGGLLGGAARRTASRAGLGSFVPVPDFAGVLSKEIACKLDAKEQAQAAAATEQATQIQPVAPDPQDDSATSDTGATPDAQRGENGEDGEDFPQGPRVGQSASWTSNSRRNVRGTSTVTARQRNAGSYDDCIMVTDVIIVEGEETRAEKRMCRPVGSARYSIVA